jgi:hypothetical protein
MKNPDFLKMLKDFGLLRSDLTEAAMDAMTKVAEELDEKDEAEDETPEEKEKREKAEKEKADKEKADKEGKSGKAEDSVSAADHKAALDSARSEARAAALKEFQELQEAKTLSARVVPTDCALDSAEEYYKLALTTAGVAFDGVTELSGLKALLVAHNKKTEATAPAKPAENTKSLDIASAFPNLKIGL